jgi:hypothetical protein
MNKINMGMRVIDICLHTMKMIILWLLSACPLFAQVDGKLSECKQMVEEIDNMPLERVILWIDSWQNEKWKWKYTATDVSDVREGAYFYLDSNRLIRKYCRDIHGYGDRINIICYYDREGLLCYFMYCIDDENTGQDGYLYAWKGNIVLHDAKIYSRIHGCYHYRFIREYGRDLSLQINNHDLTCFWNTGALADHYNFNEIKIPSRCPVVVLNRIGITRSAWINTNRVWVRSGPGTNYPAVGKADIFNSVKVLEKDREEYLEGLGKHHWYKVNFYGEMTGYVFGAFLMTYKR